MLNIFRDPHERRLRALLRLLIQALVFFLILAALQIPTGLLAPGFIEVPVDLDPNAAQQYLLNHPFLRIATGISQVIAIWLSFLFAARWLDHRPVRDFGFHFNPRWWRDLGFGLALGAVLMALVFAVEMAMGWVEITGYLAPGIGSANFWVGILAALILFVGVGINEEMLFRGYHLRNMAEGLEGRIFNPRAALLLAYFISSGIFGAAHAANPNATALSSFNIAVAGLFLGLGYVLTGELAIPIGLHITWNFFQGNVFGFPVSGTQAGATFIQVSQQGPELITGGAFGPEAGLIGLAAMLLGTMLTIAWVRWNDGSARMREELAVYSVDS